MADDKGVGQAFEGGDSMTATMIQESTVKKPAPTRRDPRPLPPYRLLIHNDDVNTFEHVIKTILQLTNLTPEEAFARTLEAHESGVALLLVTHKERAELFVDQFMSCKITTSIEPAE